MSEIFKPGKGCNWGCLIACMDAATVYQAVEDDRSGREKEEVLAEVLSHCTCKHPSNQDAQKAAREYMAAKQKPNR